MSEASIANVKAEVLRRLRNAGRVHGSAFRDLLIQEGLGSCAEAGFVERLITEMGLHPEGDMPAPTTPQGAFFYLHYWPKHPGWAPGSKEHFWLVAEAPKRRETPKADPPKEDIAALRTELCRVQNELHTMSFTRDGKAFWLKYAEENSLKLRIQCATTCA